MCDITNKHEFTICQTVRVLILLQQTTQRMVYGKNSTNLTFFNRYCAFGIHLTQDDIRRSFHRAISSHLLRCAHAWSNEMFSPVTLQDIFSYSAYAYLFFLLCKC